MDNEKVPAAMQDNVTQAVDDHYRKTQKDLEDYAREASIALTQIAGGGSEMFRRIGDEFYADPKLCEQRIAEKNANRHRLASTAQPEIKALVEALEWYEQQAANCCKLPGIFAGEEARGALDADRGKRARKALAAYHEAQP